MTDTPTDRAARERNIGLLAGLLTGFALGLVTSLLWITP